MDQAAQAVIAGRIAELPAAKTTHVDGGEAEGRNRQAFVCPCFAEPVDRRIAAAAPAWQDPPGGT